MTSAGVPYEEVHFTSGSGSGSQSWNDITNKPSYIVDWTVDQGDTNIDANNIPILPYATNQLASNGTPGLTNYNFNAARKTKLEGIETGAQVNVDPAWTSVTSKPTWLDELFPDSAASHTVQNEVGDIHQNKTVGYLRANYTTLSQVVAKMLKIEAPQVTIPAHSGANLTILTSSADVKYGDPYPSGSITVTFNRGSWTNAFQSDGVTVTDLLPHNPGSVTLSGGAFTFGSLQTTSETLTTGTYTATQSIITFTSSSITTGTFNNWSDQVLDASMTTSNTSTGTVYNNYGNVTTATPISQPFSDSKTWKVYKPVYVGNNEVISDAKGTSGAAGFSNLNGTVKVFSSTNDIIVTDHVFAHKIVVPFTPANVYEYTNFGDSSAWYSVSFTHSAVTVPTYGSYHEITITTPRTLNVDVKISKL